MRYIDETEAASQYDDMLDEVHGEFMNLPASRILKEIDPIAYRVGMSDWLDSEDLTTDESEAHEDDEERCPACGDLPDYCQGHGEIGDPEGFAILQAEASE